MPQDGKSLADRAYRLLLGALPFDFRSDYGDEMAQVFHDQRRDARDRVSLTRLWGETIAGIFRTAPREHLAILWQDIRFASRTMESNPGYTAVAILTLALGIGASTAIFSAIYGTLLRPLPYRNGNELMVLHQSAAGAGTAEMGFSVHEIEDYRAANRSFAELVEYHNMNFTLFGQAQPERVQTGVVSAGFFDMFGIHAVMGRTFLSTDDQAGAPPVLLLSYEYWQSRGSDPHIVGRVFKMNDRAHTVIGVLPPFPQYPNENDVYMPTSACPYRSSARFIANRDARMMRVFARLKPGATETQAAADLEVIAARLRQDYPQSYPKAAGYRIAPRPLLQDLTQDARPLLFVLIGAAGFVLLIACANVANMILARMTRRDRELAVRSALGAGMARLFRQLLTESVIQGLLAAGLGILMAFGSVKLLAQFAGRFTPRAREIQVDGYVLLFALVAALATSILFGTLSALQSRSNLAAGMKDARHRSKTRNVLIVCQVAFSYILLIGAGLLGRSLLKLEQVDPGFQPQSVLTARVALNWSKYNTAEETRAVARKLVRELQSRPGVGMAAVASSYPLDPLSAEMGFLQRVQIEGRPLADRSLAPQSNIRSATPDYFGALGIPITAGRRFAETDDEHAVPVAIVNQAFAKHYFPTDDPIGKRISLTGDQWIRIVGVAGDVHEFALDRKPGDEIYVPLAQNPSIRAVMVRTFADPLDLAGEIRKAVLDADPETALFSMITLEQARDESIAAPKVLTKLVGLFAMLSLVIAAAGIGGILALAVSQRRREIGVRMALGARPGDVRGMLLSQGMLLVAAGLAVGFAGALALTRVLRGFLFEVTPTDIATFAGVSVVLLAAALMACYIPSHRATRLDPLTELRCE